ncbi:MAG: hypothetical protein FH762_18020 [Firmicutes bacterium]|nr:hypothetical protein [Bacillota bacterium]
MKDGDILIKKEDIDRELPDYLEAEKDIVVHYWTTIYSDSLCAVGFFNKRGTRRLSREDSKLIEKTLEKITGINWFIDGVSNFVIHLDKNQLFSEKKTVQLSLFEVIR